MGVNYTPEMGNYRELKPFRFWCQKVLPLVYDDSLSYYELLNKVVDYLNKTMEDVDTLHTDVENLHTAYVQLQTYVNDYFDNLDVQEEINNKLDDMASSGELTTLLEPFIPPLITAWLNDNITPTSPPIDKSLTVENAGADAKVTGNKIRQLTYAGEGAELAKVNRVTGGYIENGAVVEYDSWSYSDYIDVSDFSHGYFLGLTEAPDGTSYNAIYDKDKNYIEAFRLTNELTAFTLRPNAHYIRVSGRINESICIYNALFDQNDLMNNPRKWYWYSAVSAQTGLIELKAPKYVLTVPDGYQVSIENYRPDGTVINYTTYAGSREYFRSNNCSHVKLYVRKADQTNLDYSDEMLDKITFEPKESFERIEYFKILTLNVGLFYNGITRLPANLIDEYKVKWHRFLGETNPDVMCLQEAPDFVDINNTVRYGEFMDFKFPFHANVYDIGKIKAKDSILSATLKSFASGSSARWAEFKYQVGDTVVTVWDVHLTTEANSTGIRQQDLDELAQGIASRTHTIIVGDFNSYSLDEITSRFGSYNVANGGNFGEYITWPNVSENWPNGSIDNIITTTDISMQNVVRADVEVSDHKPLMAELNVYY